jgi:hypothetical protein
MTPKKTPKRAPPPPAVAAPATAPAQAAVTARAIFVSLARTYAALPVTEPAHACEVLRRATFMAWKIKPKRAEGVQWLLGVFGGRVMSIYPVRVPASEWLTIPDGSPEAGRRIIPAEKGEARHFDSVRSVSGLRLYGPVQYGAVQTNADGAIVNVTLGDDS